MNTPKTAATKKKQPLKKRGNPLLATYVRKERRRQGITQEAIAKTLGVHTQNVWNWERHVSPIPVKHLKGLAELLSLQTYRVEGCIEADMLVRLSAKYGPLLSHSFKTNIKSLVERELER